MKEYKVRIQRTYNTTITLKFPDDGRLHWNTIDDKLGGSDSDLWDLIAEKELEQMDVSNEAWKIDEIYDGEEIIGIPNGDTMSDTDDDENQSNIITGALSNDTGPRN